MEKFFNRTIIILALMIILVIGFITVLYWNVNFSETYYFPYGEARFVKRKNPAVGISECHYSGETPILTCAYESKV